MTLAGVLRVVPLLVVMGLGLACGSPAPGSQAGEQAVRGEGERPMGGKGAAAARAPAPTSVRRIVTRIPPQLVESSAAAMSATQSGIVFTVNDAGNAPIVFAVDTGGAGRGAWRVLNATNIDWEATAAGPCNPGEAPVRHCLYIGDTGDNEERRAIVAIYRVPEPRATPGGALDTLSAEGRLAFRYADGPHDVEAMVVTPDGTVLLITKRPRTGANGSLRPALVFALSPSVWSAGVVATAQLVDSLPIVPGSVPRRTITDAALSSDARQLVVRTYGEVYVFAADSASGRARRDVPAAVCDISGIEQGFGEGVTFLGKPGELLLTREGRGAPMHVVTCPMPTP